jgi:trans-aconitate 2-methyltransferase
MIKNLYLSAVIFMFFSGFIMATPNWNGSIYNQHSQPQLMWFEAFSNSLPIAGNENILDIGCGDGKLTLEIAKRLGTGSIHGIDVSPSMVEFAQKTQKQKNLSFSVADARSFKLDKKFDIIVSFTTLHWIKEYEQVIQRAKEHLKPNGQIYFVFSAKWQGLGLEKALNSLYASPKWSQYFKNYDPGYYSHDIDPFMATLIKHSFSIREIALKSKLNIFETNDKFFNWLKAWLPQQHQVPAGQGDIFIQDFIDEYIKHGTKSSKGIHWEGFLLKVEAALETPMPQKTANTPVAKSAN